MHERCLTGRVFVGFLLHLITEAAPAAGGILAPRKPTAITCFGHVQKSLPFGVRFIQDQLQYLEQIHNLKWMNSSLAFYVQVLQMLKQNTYLVI